MTILAIFHIWCIAFPRKFRHSRVGRMLGIVSQVFPYQLVLELPLNGDLKSFLTKVSTEDNIR